MDPTSLRPLGVGEILDVAIKVYRAKFVELVKVVGIITAPVLIFSAIVQVSALPDMQSSFGFTEMSDPNAAPEVDFSQFWTFLAGMVVIYGISMVASQLATAAAVRMIGASYLGEDVTWRESLSLAWSRVWALIGLAILTGICVGLGFLACGIPGIYLYVGFAVAVPVLLLESTGVSAALGRSRHLVGGRWWPVAGVLVLSAMLAGVVGFAVTSVFSAVLVSTDNDLVAIIANSLSSILAGAITTPFAAAIACVLYFDLRVRKEGYDLQLLAAQVGVTPSGDLSGTGWVPPPDRNPLSRGYEPAGTEQPPYWPPPPGWKPSAPAPPSAPPPPDPTWPAPPPPAPPQPSSPPAPPPPSAPPAPPDENGGAKRWQPPRI